MKQLGLEGELRQWINDYLYDEKQNVVIRNCSSSLRRFNAGVPQGSVLGPLPFLVYVNDISESLLSLTRLNADGSSLFYSAKNLNDIEGIINHDLRILVNWAAKWLINFNPLKTETILFTLKLLEQLPYITIDGTPIKLLM